jgi:transposase
VVEVITRGDRRRAWSAEQKRLIVVEAMQPGAKAAEVIRRWGISSGLFYDWRRQVLAGELGQVPVPAPAFARAELAEPENAQPPASAVMSARAEPEATHPAAPRRSAPTRIEVELPCGTMLRVDETVGVEVLRRVLAAVRGR